VTKLRRLASRPFIGSLRSSATVGGREFDNRSGKFAWTGAKKTTKTSSTGDKRADEGLKKIKHRNTRNFLSWDFKQPFRKIETGVKRKRKLGKIDGDAEGAGRIKSEFFLNRRLR